MNARSWTNALWLAAAACAALAAWLFLPRARAGLPPRARVVAVLVDASASAASAPEWLPWVRAELAEVARATRDTGEELCVLAFADGVATGFAAGAPALFLEQLEGRRGRPFDPTLGLAREATRLADALAAVTPVLIDPERPAGELCVLGPLTYTGASPAPALARLRAAGVTIETRPGPRPAASDLGLLELVLPARVESGAPLVALARLVLRRGSAPPGAATLELELASGGVTRSFTRPIPLPALDGEFELPLECGPAGSGRIELGARCRLASGPDLLPANDRARALSLGEGVRVIGVASRPERRAAAEAWLAPAGHSALAGLEFRFLTPQELGPELAGLSALISFDLALKHLPEALLASFVRRGGGWLALSGWGFLDDWIPGQGEGVLHRMLACEPAQERAPERDVVLLVDGSGSMEGAAFEAVRAAALELVSSALPSDRVSLRFFTVQLERESVLKERSATRAEDTEAARSAARELLALRVPAGTTFLLRSLEELTRTLGEREALVLLLSDGRERDALPDREEKARAVAAEFARRRAQLGVIAVGDPDRALLAALAGGDERVHDGGTLEALRAIFRRELHGARVAEGELALRWAARAPGSLADEVASAALEAPALAPLERHVQNRLRAGGEALWESDTGEPVLALARAGLGRTALFASLPVPDWAARYARAGLGQPAEFEGLLRWLARTPDAGPAPRARLEGERLVVRGLADGSPAELSARLLDLGGTRAPEPLRLVASGELPHEVLRTRSAEPVRPGPGELALEFELDAGADASHDTGLVLPVERALPDELAWREHTLSLAARAASGGPAPDPARGPAREHPASPWVLALALALLFAAGFASARGQGVGGFRR